MASLPYLSLLFLFRFLSTTMSQDPISSSPGIAPCTTSLIPLTSCAPFVQGLAPLPPIPCCNSLRQLYINVPHCLCLLLNGTVLSSFPINTTRALQLPQLCSLEVNISTCSAPSSPNSHVSPGANTNATIVNATVAASPTDQPAPKPGTMGLGMGRTSASFKLRVGIEFTVVTAMKTLLFLLVLY